ncbi:MAG: hypothetical protein VCF24_05980 [Candidatus Latescibacterota bacterium]
MAIDGEVLLAVQGAVRTDADAAGQLEGFVGAGDVNALVWDADLVRFVNAVSG